MRVLVDLFLCFLKTGLFTFGGGYAMLAILKDELVIKKKWISEDELMNFFSLSQCTPGVIAINIATFCGYKLKKTVGAVVATFGVVTPSVSIILLIASFFLKIVENPNVVHVLNGVRIGVVALLFKIVFDLLKRIWQKNPNKRLASVIFCVALIELFFFKLSAVFVVLTAIGLFGLDAFFLRVLK